MVINKLVAGTQEGLNKWQVVTGSISAPNSCQLLPGLLFLGKMTRDRCQRSSWEYGFGSACVPSEGGAAAGRGRGVGWLDRESWLCQSTLL